MNRQTSLNLTQAQPDDDGTYRLVLSHRDPGRPQLARHHGTALWRRDPPPVPTRGSGGADTRVVNVHEVSDTLAGAPKADPDERRAQIAERREGAARLVFD